jgi:hypothetical protein
MFYKGGPRHYDTRDWKVLAGIAGTALVAFISIIAATKPASNRGAKDS